MAEIITTPGFIDIHTHLREPSDNKSETIQSGTGAALLGGFVMVSDMPNNPGQPVWDLERLITKHEIAEQSSFIPTAFYAGSQPESDNVGELEKMAPHAIGLKLYGDPTTGNINFYEAPEFEPQIREWHRVATDKPIMFHSGSHNLEDMIQLVAGKYEHPLHICHVNNSAQVELVEEAKEDGLKVTCGVCPHHLLLDSHHASTHGTFGEMMPPLARQDEAEQLMVLLSEGHIDVIETDFAPHSIESKYKAEHEGGHCFGVSGIEHVAPALFYQMSKDKISYERLMEVFHHKPAEILGVEFDDTTEVRWDISGGAYRIGENDVEANCGWSPYETMMGLGRLDLVKIGGVVVVQSGIAIEKRPQIISRRGQQVI